MRQSEQSPRLRILRSFAVPGLLLTFPAQAASSYSVLTHEAIIDSTRDRAIKHVLVERFPASSEDELAQAHWVRLQAALNHLEAIDPDLLAAVPPVPAAFRAAVPK